MMQAWSLGGGGIPICLCIMTAGGEKEGVRRDHNAGSKEGHLTTCSELLDADVPAVQLSCFS